jgi:hypothetical protein
MDAIYTLHDFMLHTKNIVYLLMAGALVGIVGFWRFLTDRDYEEENSEGNHPH